MECPTSLANMLSKLPLLFASLFLTIIVEAIADPVSEDTIGSNHHQISVHRFLIDIELNGVCQNDDNFIYSSIENAAFRSLDCSAVMQATELDRVNLCQISEVRTSCPISCGLCCEDDVDYEMLRHNGLAMESKDCEPPFLPFKVSLYTFAMNPF